MITKFILSEWINKGVVAAGATEDTTLPFEEGGEYIVLVNRAKLNTAHYTLSNLNGNVSITFKPTIPVGGQVFIIYRVPAFNQRNVVSLSPKSTEDFYDGNVKWSQALLAILSVFQRKELQDLEEVAVEDEAPRIVKTVATVTNVQQRVLPSIEVPQVQVSVTPPAVNPVTPAPELPPMLPQAPPITVIPDPPALPPDIPEISNFKSQSFKAYFYTGEIVDGRGNRVETIASLSNSARSNLFNNLYLNGSGNVLNINLGSDITLFFDNSKINTFRNKMNSETLTGSLLRQYVNFDFANLRLFSESERTYRSRNQYRYSISAGSFIPLFLSGILNSIFNIIKSVSGYIGSYYTYSLSFKNSEFLSSTPTPSNYSGSTFDFDKEGPIVSHFVTSNISDHFRSASERFNIAYRYTGSRILHFIRNYKGEGDYSFARVMHLPTSNSRVGRASVVNDEDDYLLSEREWTHTQRVDTKNNELLLIPKQPLKNLLSIYKGLVAPLSGGFRYVCGYNLNIKCEVNVGGKLIFAKTYYYSNESRTSSGDVNKPEANMTFFENDILIAIYGDGVKNKAFSVKYTFGFENKFTIYNFAKSQNSWTASWAYLALGSFESLGKPLIDKYKKFSTWAANSAITTQTYANLYEKWAESLKFLRNRSGSFRAGFKYHGIIRMEKSPGAVEKTWQAPVASASHSNVFVFPNARFRGVDKIRVKIEQFANNPVINNFGNVELT